MRGPLRDWWQGVVNTTNPQYSGGTTQGYYAFASDGTPVLWDNYIPRIAGFVERAYGAAKAKTKVPREQKRDHALGAPPLPPPGTSVARLYTRIHPLPEGAGSMNALLGRDYMWILEDEVKALAAANQIGKSFELPQTLAMRLALFHLVDNVRGSVWMWKPPSVQKARLYAKLLSVDGKIKKLAIWGDYAKQDQHPPQWTDRGQEGTIDGEVDVDVEATKIVRLRALAKSIAWSDARYSPANPPPGKYPLVTAIVEANDELAARVPPEQAGTGRYYLSGGLR